MRPSLSGQNWGDLLISFNGSQPFQMTVGSNTLQFIYSATGSPMAVIYNGTYYYYVTDIQGDVIAILNSSGGEVVTYAYDAWGNIVSSGGSMISSLGAHNPLRYRGYIYDTETKLYYIQNRFYNPQIGRFISADDKAIPKNAFAYCGNNPAMGSIQGGDLVGAGSKISNPPAPEWLKTAVSAIPDAWLAVQYLGAKGMHAKFAYGTNTRFMHPVMGGTWRWFGKTGATLADFNNVALGTFKQILTGDAKAGLKAIAKSAGGVVGLNALVNFGFNLYENNWQIDEAMLIDTTIDTAIGVGSYYLASGTMSLITAGLVTGGVAVPGIIVVGGVVLLSIGFEALIREIANYHE